MKKMQPTGLREKPRYDWVDHVKGITITLVVAYHIIMGLHNAVGIPDFVYWYDTLSPVRMPLFFLVAGLFAEKSLNSDLRDFLDNKIIRFGYLYILWSIIILIVRSAFNSIANQQTDPRDILFIFWQPLPAIWFIYALLLCFAFARLTKAISPLYLVAFAALLQAYVLSSTGFPGAPLFNRLGIHLVYFMIGIYASGWILKNADSISWPMIGGALASFAILGFVARSHDLISEPIIFFSLSALSAIVLIGLSVQATKFGVGGMFKFIGAHSLHIYLTHFIPAAGVRIALQKLGIENLYVIFTIALVASIMFGIAFKKLTEKRPLIWLSEPPRFLGPRPIPA